MVGHQCICVKRKTISVFVFIQEADVELIVFVIKEDLLASVSTCNNVIKSPKEMNPWFSRHNL